LVLDELKTLLELQEKDRAVMDIHKELAALEPELAELDRVIAALDEELEGARGRVTAAAERRESLEGKIESYRVMQERRRQKLEWVRGAKEASTLMAEIDLARSVLAKEEAEWIRSADEVQMAEAMVAEAETRVSEAREAQSGRRKEIAETQAECRDRLDKASAEREAAAQHVEPALLVRYDRVKRGRAPLALYPLHSGACGHCFTSVPMHLRQQLKQNSTIPSCEACGVMLYMESE
jgi:uncharacterized protein